MPPVRAGFFDLQSFELMQRVSKAFSASDLVPQQYRGADKIANCMIAMDMAQRMGANPLMVMQNLYIVHGTPSWSSKFLIATINASGRYSSLRYEWKGEPGKPDFGCRAWAVERETGERLDGIWVTWEMVNAEGWSKKNGSKWLTMPDQMFVYRAAAFWQRAYAPELGMGLQTVEDAHDGLVLERQVDGTFAVSMDDLRAPSPAAQPKLEERQPETVPQATRAPSAEHVDAETGEIREPQQRRQVEPQSGPGFADAQAAVRSGDFDLARDIGRALPEQQRQQIEAAIANLSPAREESENPEPAAQPARRSRGQGGLSLE